MMNSALIPAGLVALAMLTACASGPGLAPMTDASPCKHHCETHSEGYQWAQSSNLTDPAACAGYPAAFVSGCRDGVEDLRELRPYSQGI